MLELELVNLPEKGLGARCGIVWEDVAAVQSFSKSRDWQSRASLRLAHGSRGLHRSGEVICDPRLEIRYSISDASRGDPDEARPLASVAPSLQSFSSQTQAPSGLPGVEESFQFRFRLHSCPFLAIPRGPPLWWALIACCRGPE